ncbi:Bug family tripartite tricarboxylate transporter substrate binding protein [Pigmentiphaga litoralis]|uniref:Bug family tripartite tricarboxylate transporter substrate binding protein n=1 Tax=Pigmentiphaga litoralis TaxID=516702 RepID=UPI003B42A8B3
MHLTFNAALRTAALLAVTSVMATAHAADPVRLVVAFPPGGPADSLARVLAKQLDSELKTNVIVENKPGANGAIAAAHVKNSPKDGTVLFLSSAGAIAINPGLYPKLTYDPVKDFVPVSLVVHTPEVLVVSPTSPDKTAADFVASAGKAKKPRTLASSGIGSMPHMAIALFQTSTKADVLHVAYKGAAPAITDTIGGHVDGFFGDISGLLGFINEKRLKAIGVAAPQRLRALPDVPTLAELGIKNVEASNWYGVFAPAGTPASVVTTVNAAVHRALKAPSVVESLASMGIEPSPNTPEQFNALIKSDTAKWTKVIKDGNIQPE